MSVKCAPLALISATLSTVLAASLAAAACNDRDRPGTPDEVKGEARSATSIRISFRNSSLWWDVIAREDSAAGHVFDNRAGVGPSGFVDGQHRRAYFDFFGLKPNKNYCVQILARTEQGKEGCTSKFVASACVATPAVAAPPDKPVKRLGKLALISVAEAPNDVFVVSGTNFTTNASVTIDVSGEPTTVRSITVDINSVPIVADAKGSFRAMISNVCNRGRKGTVVFTARDKDRFVEKKNAVKAQCRLGIEQVPRPGIKTKR